MAKKLSKRGQKRAEKKLPQLITEEGPTQETRDHAVDALWLSYFNEPTYTEGGIDRGGSSKKGSNTKYPQTKSLKGNHHANIQRTRLR